MDYKIQTNDNKEDFKLLIKNTPEGLAGLLEYCDKTDYECNSKKKFQTEVKEKIINVENNAISKLKKDGHTCFSYPLQNIQYHSTRIDITISDSEPKTKYVVSILYIRERHSNMVGSNSDFIDRDIIEAFIKQLSAPESLTVTHNVLYYFHYDKKQVNLWLSQRGHVEGIKLIFESLNNTKHTKKALLNIRTQDPEKKFFELFGLQKSFIIPCNSNESYALSKSLNGDFKYKYGEE